MKIIIIEDELRTAKELKGILNAIDSEIDVLDILPSVSSATNWLKSNPQPDLIFSDIQLGDGLSFEIFKACSVSVPVVFCTAYDQYAIEAFDSNGIDYLLKPIEEETVEKALEKIKRIKTHFAGNNSYAVNLNKTINQLDLGYKQSILVHFREKIIPVKTNSISYAYATGGTVVIHINTGDEYIVHYTIDQLETFLDSKLFFRANRQYILHRDSVQNIEHYFNRRLFVKTCYNVPEKIIVSRLKAQDFLKWLEQH